jgi:hypothetical protein
MSGLRVFDGLGHFAEALEQMAGIHIAAVEATAEASSHVLQKNVVDTFGDSSKLADLAQATQDERVRLGYSANDPLLRTGELLRDSVERVHVGLEVAVGSNEPVMLYHEFGYVNARTGTSVPPRPAFKIGMEESAPEIGEMVEKAIAVTLNGGISLP